MFFHTKDVCAGITWHWFLNIDSWCSVAYEQAIGHTSLTAAMNKMVTTPSCVKNFWIDRDKYFDKDKFELLAQPVVCLGFVILLEAIINLSLSGLPGSEQRVSVLACNSTPWLPVMKLTGFPSSFAVCHFLPPLLATFFHIRMQLGMPRRCRRAWNFVANLQFHPLLVTARACHGCCHPASALQRQPPCSTEEG